LGTAPIFYSIYFALILLSRLKFLFINRLAGIRGL